MLEEATTGLDCEWHKIATTGLDLLEVATTDLDYEWCKDSYDSIKLWMMQK